MFEPTKDTTGKILIVDDNPINIDVLCKTLESDNYKISVVLNGENTLKVASKFLPDLILLDIMMPGIDGFEVCRLLKKDKITRDIPIIFITAKTEVEDIVKAFEMGAVDYITKPINQQEVMARVKTHLTLTNLISTKGKLIAELESNNKKLVEVNELKDKFLGMAAHDLRNPLSAIRGFSELMLEEMPISNNEEAEELLTLIRESSQHMMEMVEDLLDYSVIETGNLELQLRKHSIKEFVESRIKVSQYLAERKNIQIQEVIEEVPDTIFDKRRMSQVLDNLLSNAIKYSHSGTSVTVKVEAAGQNIEFMVKDEGQGIPPEEQSRLFQSFPKLSSKPTGGEKSVGLGLTIVKKIIDAHGGSLKVESEPGVGSIFLFSLPLKD
jgi:two-component system, sensor histidine kinase and response regulator